jgi:hypothetical protein
VKKINFEVYPNPTTSKFFVSGKLDNYKIRLIDTKGSILKSLTSINNKTKVDISNYKNGAYFIELENKRTGKVDYRKIVIKQ